MEHLYEYWFTVEKDAIDENDHVSNIIYIKWMQEAVTKLSESLGFPLERYKELGMTWIVKSHHIDYLRSALLGDEITVQTWLRAIDRAKFTREYKFIRRSDQKVLAKATTEWVCFDLKANRVCRVVDEEILQTFQVYKDA